MRRILALTVLAFALAANVNAQTITTTVCPGVGCQDINTAGQGSIGIQITGTWVGTITFQSTLSTAPTGTFTSLLMFPSNSQTGVTTTASNGIWTAAIAGINQVRVVFTAFTSGTANVTFRITNQARSTGGGAGGGGGSGTVTQIDTTSPITGGPITATGTIACGTCGVTGSPLSQFAATTSLQLLGVISDETGTGALVFGTSPTLTTPVISGAIVFPDDVRQTFNPGANASGLNVGAQAGDPGTPTNGDLWYDSVANELTARINGANVALGAGGGGAPADATYITQTANGTLSNEQALSALSSGIMRVATTTGVVTSLTDSAGIAANISDETGTTLLVFSDTPTFSTAVNTSLTSTATSGTVNHVSVLPSYSPTATSTMVAVPFRIAPIINYSNGTPGAGRYEALKIAVTETALPTGANYLIRGSTGVAGATDVFTVARDGQISYNSSGHIIGSGGGSQMIFGPAGSTIVTFNSAGSIVKISALSNGTAGAPSIQMEDANSTLTIGIFKDATYSLGLRVGTNPQILNLYNTFTSTSVFERLSLTWSSNVAHIGTATTGGTARVMQLDYGGTTTSAISIPITSGDITFGGVVFPTGYKSADGTAGVTVTSCTGFKNGLCISGT